LTPARPGLPRGRHTAPRGRALRPRGPPVPGPSRPAPKPWPRWRWATGSRRLVCDSTRGDPRW